MIINRAWCMPNKDTFSIKPINELIRRYLSEGKVRIDPFSGDSPFKDFFITNDLNPEIEADNHLDALDFLKMKKRFCC